MVSCGIETRTSSYLLESDGQVLLVRVRYSAHREMDYKGISSINVFKVEPDNRRLVQVKSIGDHALFIGRFCCLSVSTKVIPSIRRNCIYFSIKEFHDKHVYNIGECCFYVSPKSNLVVQLVSYCHHVRWLVFVLFPTTKNMPI